MQRRYDKAMHYFELAASENDWQAVFQLGVMYFDGIHCEPDMVRLFHMWSFTDEGILKMHKLK